MHFRSHYIMRNVRDVVSHKEKNIGLSYRNTQSTWDLIRTQSKCIMFSCIIFKFETFLMFAFYFLFFIWKPDFFFHVFVMYSISKKLYICYLSCSISIPVMVYQVAFNLHIKLTILECKALLELGNKKNNIRKYWFVKRIWV